MNALRSVRTTGETRHAMQAGPVFGQGIHINIDSHQIKGGERDGSKDQTEKNGTEESSFL